MRLREADSMAAVAELRQKIAELEIQVCYCAILLSFNIFLEKGVICVYQHRA